MSARFRAVGLHLYVAGVPLPATLAAIEDALERDVPHEACGLLGAWHGAPPEFEARFAPASLACHHLAAVRARAQGDTDRWGGLPGVYDRVTGTAHLLVQLPADAAYATAAAARALLLVLDGRAQEAADTLLPHERLDAIRLCHYYGVRL